MPKELEYYERQRIPWWMILLIAMINVPFITGCIVQLGMGKPWGDKPMSDTMLIIVTVLIALLTIGSSFLRLDTVINKEGVYEQMFPVQLKFGFTPWSYISDVSLKKNFWVYGGWGIRYNGFGEKSYYLSGNNVIQLTLMNGKKVLIGTRKPKEVADFLSKLNEERKQE